MASPAPRDSAPAPTTAPGTSTRPPTRRRARQENRTFDQTFGSLGKGDGDASLNLFGEESAPNQRAGVPPLTQFDSYAAPMVASFARSANTNPYTAVRPDQAGEIVIGTDAPMARASQARRLDREDQINERTFNEAIWKNVRGERSAMPAPRHTLWGAVPNAVEDDD